MLYRRPSLRGAIIGYGFISERGHAPAYKALAQKGGSPLEIVAVADTCAARREKARAEMPGVRIYENAEALFALEQGQIDFVDISAPPSEHAPLALRADWQATQALAYESARLNVGIDQLAKALQEEQKNVFENAYRH